MELYDDDFCCMELYAGVDLGRGGVGRRPSLSGIRPPADPKAPPIENENVIVSNLLDVLESFLL